MGKFQGELHSLCEGANWEELRSILTPILSHRAAENADADGSESDNYEDGDHFNSAQNIINTNDDGGFKLSNKNLDLKINYDHNHDHNLPHSSDGKDNPKKYHRQSSLTHTCGTTATSCISTEPVSVISSSAADESWICERRGMSVPEERSSIDNGDGHNDGIASQCDRDSVKKSIAQEQQGGVTTELMHHCDYAPQSPTTSNTSSIRNTHPPTPPLPAASSLTPEQQEELSPERIQHLQNQLLSREGANRWTPLMIACACAPPSVISLLVQVCPEACGIPDRSGSLPLHFVSCWRRGGLLEQKQQQKTYPQQQQHQKCHPHQWLQGIHIPQLGDELGSRSSGGDSHICDGSEAQKRHQTVGPEDQCIQNEICLILCILISAHPNSLAISNRWGQTPLHALFESKRSQYPPKRLQIERGRDAGHGLFCMVKTLLGIWDKEMYTQLETLSYNTDPNRTSSIKESIRARVKRALRTRDAKGRLPLHTAAGCEWVDESMLRAVTSAFPPATWIPVTPPFNGLGNSFTRSSGTSFSWDMGRNISIQEELEKDENIGSDGLFPKTGGCYGRDLAVHILHRKLLSPLSPLSNHPSSSYHEFLDEEDGVKSCVTDASVFLKENHCGEISALLEPLASASTNSREIVPERMDARLACAATGSGQHPDSDATQSPLRSQYSSIDSTPGTLFPIHIAAIHGVSCEILEGLCRAYPEGVCTPMNSTMHMDRLNLLPIELFEEGRAGHEVHEACNTTFPSLMTEYFRRSDLLFSYFPEAVSSKKIPYCRDEVRLNRFEELIRGEASNLNPGELLSDVAGSVWLFMCKSGGSGTKGGGMGHKTRLPNFAASIGRILNGLAPPSLLKLSFVRTSSAPEGVRVPPLSCSGRTVLEEARERAPQQTMKGMLNENFFHSSMLSFLTAHDALSFSSTCWKARASGVRLLPEVAVDDMDAMDSILSVDFPRNSTTDEIQRDNEENKILKPWQKLILPFAPKSTHTVFITYDVHYTSTDDEGVTKGGGLFVVRDDSTTASSPTQFSPELCTLDTVVASIPNDSPCQIGNLLLSFFHCPGHKYTLWFYGHESHTLTITNLRIQQLVYACDYNGHTPLHSLLNEGDNPTNLKDQIEGLVDVGFGSSHPRHAVGELPIHYALKVGTSEKTLRCLIQGNPSALLYTDSKKRTALHAAFDMLSSSSMPHIGIVQALLTPPGNSATQLKDSTGRLPLHIAAEHGAAEGILRVLVDSYADGCYRQTDAGDLPLHLLVRSEKATQITAELLIRPIMDNPTICAYRGSQGVNLPLHIACQFCCKYDIIEGLLSTYDEAARIPRQLMKSESKCQSRHKKPVEYALAIFEEGRGAPDGIALDMEITSAAKRRDSDISKGSTWMALGYADFDLRSDLIFVHNPDVPKTQLPYLPTFYRDEHERIERLKTVIKREATQCSKNGGDKIALTEMARIAWCWMCCNDDYANVVSEIVHALSLDAVRFLSMMENPKSLGRSPIKDSSAPRCSIIITTRLSFLGRYVLDHGSAPLYKSESSVVLRAKDISAMEEYLLIQNRLSDAEPDIDEYSHSCGTVYGIKKNSVEIAMLLRFSEKLGLEKPFVFEQIETLMHEFNEIDDDMSLVSSLSEVNDIRHSGIKKAVFDEFCKLHGVDSKGRREVVIKFMKNQRCFELEQDCRELLRCSGKLNQVVPSLLNFSLDIDDEHNFCKDFHIVGFRHGIVMLCADRDLGDIFYREGMTPTNLRENARQIGEALKALHEQGIVYLDLQLKNVLRFGNKMLLTDFGSSHYLNENGIIGGISTRICPSLLPPEMVAKIHLGSSFDQFNNYWSHVYKDATTLRIISPNERQDISQCVESWTTNSSPNIVNDQSWKEGISSSLETINFNDLPQELATCSSIPEFNLVWERMRSNLSLWESVVRPRVDKGNKLAYALKVFDDRLDAPHGIATLPFSLVAPSEKVDVWQYGIFLYELCSGGNPFHIGYQGDLRGVDAYQNLYNWDKCVAKRSIDEHVQDPMAQDLLCRILVPESERLPNMMAVLSHPFFEPKSLDAERFLEKHEEMQILQEESVFIKKVSSRTRKILNDSMEKYCKIAFAAEQVVFPTCLVVLPYDLRWDESLNRPVATLSQKFLSCAESLGYCLLEINKATARLSFWLMMNAKMRGEDGDEFKSQMKIWLKRARVEPCQIIAIQIVNALGCSPNYTMLCEEILTFDSNISKAKSYMKDPIRAARRAIKEHTDSLAGLYQSLSLYLVDEVQMIPGCATDKCHNAYPIHLDPNIALFQNTLLPFMNIAVMKALARGNFEGLSKLLGLPPTFGIPESWKASESGIIHSLDTSDSLEEFVSLQSSLRKKDLEAFLDDESVACSSLAESVHSGISSVYEEGSIAFSVFGSTSIAFSQGNPALTIVPMVQLELLLRKFDSDRLFGGLRHVSGGEKNNLGIWTSEETIQQWKSEEEMVDLEEQLQQLKSDLDKRKEADIQLKQVLSRLESVKIQTRDPTSSFYHARETSCGQEETSDNSQTHHQSHDISESSSNDLSIPLSNPHSDQMLDDKEYNHSESEDEIVITRKMVYTKPARTDQDNGNSKKEPDGKEGKKKKMRKSKRRFRPWFGAC